MYTLPIVVLTYTRLSHLKKTVTALQKNTLAKESEIFFLSDGPKKGDEEKVTKLREYLYTINGFKKINIIEQKSNDYLKNTILTSEKILKRYGSMISMEDDIVTAPGFLQFMNDAEKFYKKNKKVFSISGYTPPIKIPTDIKEDSFSLRRFSGWGNILWADKYFSMKPITKSSFEKSNKREIAKYGIDLLTMMDKQTKNILNANDLNIMYHQYENDMYTIYPKKSLVQNIGHDGTGIHCGISNIFHHEKLWNKVVNFKFNNKIELNKEILKNNFKFRLDFNIWFSDIMGEYIKEHLNKRNINSLSVYGVSKTSEKICIELLKSFKINNFIDSFAEKKEILCCNQKAITPKQAVDENEKIFLILSWNNKELLKNILINLNENLIIITFDDIINTIFKDQYETI